MEVINKDEVEVMKYLLSLSSNLVDFKDEKGNTPLGFALENNKTNAVNVLLSLGAKLCDW